MPTVPLYTPNSVEPDASHEVTAPGGYEWWYFDAEDPSTDTQIAATLFNGGMFHPGYLRAYRKYLRNPTDTDPPLPQEYVCANFIVYRGGKVLHQFMTQYPKSQYRAAVDWPDVTIGRNRFSVDDTEARTLDLTLEGTPWKFTALGPRLENKSVLAADLSFKPLLSHAPRDRTLFSRDLDGAEHHWVIANPLCEVEGVIQYDGGAPDGPPSPKGPRTYEFKGHGYHDHHYGTRPIGRGLRRWFSGRVLLDDRALMFHFARAHRGGLFDEVHLIDADETGFREVVCEPGIDWSARTAFLLNYPSWARFGDVLSLSHPRVIDAQSFRLRIIYDAHVKQSGGSTRRGQAFCEVAYPHRLHWPVLGRVMEMGIEKKGRSVARDT